MRLQMVAAKGSSAVDPSHFSPDEARTVIPGERSETRDPGIIKQRVCPWVPDNAFGVSGMTEFSSVGSK
jgi:hypothetical protein